MGSFSNTFRIEQDERVLRAVTTLTSALSAPAVRARHVCKELGVDAHGGEDMRAVDRALRRLRRRDILTYDSALGWQLTGKAL